MIETYISPDSPNATKIEGLIHPITMEKPLQLRIEYDADFRSAKILRDGIEKICDITQIPAVWKSRIILITDEMNNNAIEYGTKQ